MSACAHDQYTRHEKREESAKRGSIVRVTLTLCRLVTALYRTLQPAKAECARLGHSPCGTLSCGTPGFIIGCGGRPG